MTAPTDNMARVLPLLPLPQPDASPLGDNMTLALRRITPGEWLSQTDGHVLDTFQALLARRRFTEACDFLLTHLQRTEHTRTREHGPAPDWDDAVVDFEFAAWRLTHQLASDGVNVTALAADLPAAWIEGRPTAAASPSAAGSCASDAPTLRPVPGPVCGHVDQVTGLTCTTDRHPRNPGAHYYRSAAAQDGAR